jgi:hypothetical protein
MAGNSSNADAAAVMPSIASSSAGGCPLNAAFNAAIALSPADTAASVWAITLPRLDGFLMLLIDFE